MSAFKGTPGPWSVGAEDSDSGEVEVVSEARPYVCMVLPGAIDGTTAANARLIAAAPELLAVLQHIHAYGYSMQEYEMVKAAITKATGEPA